MLGAQKLVLGAEHPDTLISVNNLAGSLLNQGTRWLLRLHRSSAYSDRPTPTRCRLQAAWRTCRLSFAPRRRPRQPHRPPQTRRDCCPPALASLLVHRLVAKPEHSGKRARVVSFDARTGRYDEALDNGRELSLKVECLAPAGCAAVGCASEEASGLCSRCQAVRYSLRESSARNGRRTSRFARQRSHERWRVLGSYVP